MADGTAHYAEKVGDTQHIYIYIYKLKNKVIQKEGFNVKESQHYNVSVLMNHHQDQERMISIDIKSE